MRPLIFDMLFNDDRKFVMEISRVTVNGEPKWAGCPQGRPFLFGLKPLVGCGYSPAARAAGN
jgi:hypothetical protein